MSAVTAAIAAIEADADPDRSVCNELLTAMYGARHGLETPPDPDISENVVRSLDAFEEGGKFCLQRKGGLRDTWLSLGRSGITLVEQLLEERYAETGVPGLAEPMEGGTEIGRRALEHWQ